MSRGGSWRRKWSQVAELASSKADIWRREGLGAGVVIAFVGGTTPELVLGVLAAWMSGAAVMVLPPTIKSEALVGFCKTGRAQRLCVSSYAEPWATSQPHELPPLVLLDLDEWLSRTTSRRVAQGTHELSDLAVLQATSGSTNDPRLVCLTETNVAFDLAQIRTRLGIADSDSLLSWLPLYHDMGLLGFLAQGWSTFVDTTLLDPGVFLAQPSSWLKGIAQVEATVTAAPNFAYGLAARALDLGGGSLASLRAALCGAEQVQLSTMHRFLASTSPLGFDDASLMPVYGLGEATLAVTIPIARRSLASEVSSDGVQRALLGSALDTTQVRIVVTEDEVPTRRPAVGRVQVRGPHVSAGYLTPHGIDRRHISAGWLDTGDRGELTAEGELIILGRYKELMILGGRNVSPEPIEEIASEVPGIRPGGVVAFSVPQGDSERLVVVFESTSDDDSLPRQVRDAVLAATGEMPIAVPCPPRSLPRTTSGKKRRVESRRRYLQSRPVSQDKFN